MAKKKSSRRGKGKGKAMQVVSLKSALHMVKRAERAIKARRIKRKNPHKNPLNPLKHFPKMKGRGRPEKVRSFEITTVLVDGATAQRKVTGTWGSVAKGVNRIMAKKHASPKGGSHAVREILVDDGR